MAVECNAITDYVKWTSPGFGGSSKRTLLMWVNFNITAGASIFHPIFSMANLAGSSSDTTEWLELEIDSDTVSSGFGWPNITYKGLASPFYTTVTNHYNKVSLSGWKHIAITVDGNSPPIYPVLYVNTTLVTNPTPVSRTTYNSGGSFDLHLNYGSISSANSDVIQYGSICLYNRILSTAEIADAYSSKLAIPNTTGLVFAAQLQGCAGNVGDGGTLSSSNTVANITNGVLGVPNGTVVFRQDAKLTY